MKRITTWAAVLTLTLSLLTGCAQIDESSAEELPFPSEETPVEEEHSGLPAVFALPYLEGAAAESPHLSRRRSADGGLPPL